MNERIRELAKQATRQYSPTYYTQEWIQGFAELIVAECAEIAKHNVMNISTYADADFVDQQIKQHFGVEE